MRFEWDEDKSRRNLAKHKVSFETARLAFDDPQVRSAKDRVVEGEERWQTMGMVSGTVLLVAHTYRDEAGDEVIRLISARKAVARERREYAKSQKHSSE
ncbi:MAG: BrnT family toxin [Bryobacteraceae bacterium]